MGEDGEPLMCGIIMPISEIDGRPESHWKDVLKIIKDAINEAGFESNLVSDADDVGIIHKRIIQNLYDNPIVVCDVSGKNPNVMFELGLRLAFDKPTIIVKDDDTSYSFDTSGIEHLEYPRDLRFNKIVDFKKKLSEKIGATSKRAATDPTYTTFLKHFGEFKVAKLDKKEVSGQEFILDELKSIKQSIRTLDNRQRRYERPNWSGSDYRRTRELKLILPPQPHDEFQINFDRLVEHPDIAHVQFARKPDNGTIVSIFPREGVDPDYVEFLSKNILLGEHASPVEIIKRPSKSI